MNQLLPQRLYQFLHAILATTHGEKIHSDADATVANPLWIYEGATKTVVSAKTHSREQAEKLAQAVRGKRDPVKMEVQKNAKREDTTDAVKLKLFDEAIERWITGMTGPGEKSISIYRGAVRRIQRWGERVGVVSSALNTGLTDSHV